MVEEQEVRLRLLRLIEDLMQRRERDQHPASLRSHPSDLEPAVVPALGERDGGYPLHGPRYVSHARHARSALYNPRGSEPCAQASSTDLRRHPPATPRRTALSRYRSAGRRIARPSVGSPLPISDERALARLPRVPGALWQGPRPAQHPPIRAGASPARGSRTPRRGLRDRYPPRRPRSASRRPPLLLARHPALRPPHALYEPLAPRRRRLRRGGMSHLRLRTLGVAHRNFSTARVVGEDDPRAPHAGRTGRRRAGRGRCDVRGVPPDLSWSATDRLFPWA